MKTNIKALELIEKGLSAKTVGKLDESQINVLHSKLLGEQVVEVPGKKTFKVGPKGGKVGNVMVSQDPNTKEVMVTTENELGEDVEVTTDPNKDVETQDPHQVGPSSDDGFGNEDDGMGIFEKKEEDSKPNAWSICHSKVGPKKSRKWERCVKQVKEQLKEGKNPVSLFLENEIMKIVEKNLPPRITKGDLVKYLTEQGPATAPSKPKTPPTTKPGKPDKKPKPSHPGKNPNPGENPSPKAGKVSPEDAKDKIIDVIMKLLEK
jgi:hypothetical protein